MNSVTSSANANNLTSITHGCRLPPCCGSDGSSQQIGGMQVTGSGGWLCRGFVRSVSKRWEKDRREGGIEGEREECTHSQAEPKSAVKPEESLHIRWGAFTGSPSIARSRFGIHKINMCPKRVIRSIETECVSGTFMLLKLNRNLQWVTCAVCLFWLKSEAAVSYGNTLLVSLIA